MGKTAVSQTPGHERVAVRTSVVRCEVRHLIGRHFVHINIRPVPVADEIKIAISDGRLRVWSRQMQQQGNVLPY